MGTTETSVNKKDLLPLLMLDANPEDTVDGITRFQKLVFLLQKGGIDEFSGVPEELSFNYEAHNYGPYSQDLHNRLDDLVDRGLIKRSYSKTPNGNRKETYELKSDIKSELDDQLDEIVDDDLEVPSKEVSQISNSYGDMPLLELLDRVYEAYPDYTTESVL